MKLTFRLLASTLCVEILALVAATPSAKSSTIDPFAPAKKITTEIQKYLVSR